MPHLLLVCTLWLAGCAVEPPPGPPELSLRPVGYDMMAGWQQDPVSSLLPSLLRQCRRLALLPADTELGGAGEARAAAGRAADWMPFCRAAQWVRTGDDAQLRQVIAAWLQPYEVGDRGDATARFTGYFEPEVPGVLARDPLHAVPVYRRPPDLLTLHDAGGGTTTGRSVDGRMQPYWTRAQIDHGALAGQGLEIAWLADPVDLFILQLQGSGRLRLPSGQFIRLGYAGRNGAPYVPLGRLLVEQGQLAPNAVGMRQVRGWLQSHPGEAQALMERDPNYVFFRTLDTLRPDQGPIGALGVDLQPGRAVAVDRAFLPLAAPLWIETDAPEGGSLRRLTLAQDLGTDITGPARADIFFGWGAEAARRAGGMHGEGRLVVLRPRPQRTVRR